MYRIILVDDEPLILAGIASLINWEDYECTLIGKANNGASAFDMITALKPDIVITDIRMPVLSGLELIEKCKQQDLTFASIVLTNLEEFQLVRKALALGSSDYLVKLNLEPSNLVEALDRAKKSCDLLVKSQNHQLLDHLQKNCTKDAIKQYLKQLLTTASPPEEKPEELDAQYPQPLVIIFSLRPDQISFNPTEEPFDLRMIDKQIVDIISGISSRFFKSYTIMEYAASTYLLVGSLKQQDDFKNTIQGFCTKINTALKTYFELTAVFGISTCSNTADNLPAARMEAETAMKYYYYNSVSPFVFYQNQKFHYSTAKNFNINFLKKDLSSSIQQNDSSRLLEIFNQLTDLFTTYKPNKEHATSACINLYTYLYSFFDDDTATYQDIFPYTINIAEQLNQFNSLTDILTWLQSFGNKLCKLLADRKENRSDKLVEQAKRYVNLHFKEKLALADIAEALTISPGYLSNSFKKFSGLTLSDYIAEVKINHAKELIDSHQFLMYEISDQLGFENPYYFSKVFKKIVGISPREHENRII